MKKRKERIYDVWEYDVSSAWKSLEKLSSAENAFR